MNQKWINWSFVKSCLATRREMRRMERDGYQRCEPVWEIIRGGDYNKVIVDVKISVDRKHVWVKVGEP